ncbi:MAG: hypothetical protein IID37_03925 [Planctomycetes bacterium]|nr:hypothetical protein [Planctomycetota bacterium]
MTKRLGKKLGGAISLLALLAGLLPAGCRSEVHTTSTVTVHEESQPEMVSPGEMVVE